MPSRRRRTETSRSSARGRFFHYLRGRIRSAPFRPGISHRRRRLPPDIAIHCEEIAAADGIVVVHPNWWGQPPAILKGWIDRVIRPGVAYEFLEPITAKACPSDCSRPKPRSVLNTSNTEPEREKTAFGDPLELIWKNCIFALCGVPNFYRRMFTNVVTSSEEQRKAWLLEVEQIVDKHFPGI